MIKVSNNIIYLIANKLDVGKRLDQYITIHTEFSRQRVINLIENGYVKLNNKIINLKKYKIKGEESIEITIPEIRELNPLPENIPIDIVYEDDDLVIVNKPAGIVVHPGHGNYSGTLLNGLLHHFQQLPKNSNNRPGLVHRIDKDTSGLLVVAKTEEAMTHLAKQFFDKTSERKYLALVWGDFEEDQGTVRGAIGRHPKNRLQMTVFEDNSQGKEAVTHFRVVERFGYVTLLECQLETGRTHQIRAHMKSIGHTLFNDARYGGDRILKGTSFTKYKQFVENCFSLVPRQALHAKTLGFIHPETQEKMQFDSPIPDDLEGALQKWRQYAQHKKLQ